MSIKIYIKYLLPITFSERYPTLLLVLTLEQHHVEVIWEHT